MCKRKRGRGNFLNAKNRNCCAWPRPDKMVLNSKWHKGRKDNWVPLPGIYHEENGKYYQFKEGEKVEAEFCGMPLEGNEPLSPGNWNKKCCEGMLVGENAIS